MTPGVRPTAGWRVAEVRALPGYRLQVRFNDGTEGCVDMAPFLRSSSAGIFATLRDEAVFREVGVVLGAVTWPGGLDLAPDAMHREINENGTWVVR